MNGKTLNFDDVEINKIILHGSKQSIILDSVNINRIVISVIFKHSDNRLKYFIG